MSKITIQSHGDNSFRILKSEWTEFEVKAKNFELQKIYTTQDEYKVRAKQVYTQEVLFWEPIENIEVDGVTYSTYEELSQVLTPILFKKGGGSGSGGTSVWSSDVLLGYQFGKYSAGSTLPSNGKTDEEVIKDAFQGVLDANVVAPSFSFTRNNSTTLFEVGFALNQTFTGSYNPGGIYGKLISGSWQTAANSTNKQANRAGSLNSFTIDGTTYTDLDNPKMVSVSRTIINGTNSFSGSVNFNAGTSKPKNSNGDEYGSIYTSPLTLSGSVSVVGLYPYFYGVIDANQTVDDVVLGNLTKVVASSSGTVTIPYSGVVDKKLVIAIPSSSPIKLKWYIDALNNNLTSENNGVLGTLFPVIGSKTYNSPSGLWSNQGFRVYVSSTTSINTNLELRNS